MMAISNMIMIEAVAKTTASRPESYSSRHNKQRKVKAEQKQPHCRQPEMIPERDEDPLTKQARDDEHQYTGQHKPPE